MSVGILTAERTGEHVKLTMQYPEGYSDRFVVERFDGMTTDADGNPAELWNFIHTGTAKFVQGDTDYELGGIQDGPDGRPVVIQLTGPRTYRAQAFRKDTMPGMPANVDVPVFATDGSYTASVTIE